MNLVCNIHCGVLWSCPVPMSLMRQSGDCTLARCCGSNALRCVASQASVADGMYWKDVVRGQTWAQLLLSPGSTILCSWPTPTLPRRQASFDWLLYCGGGCRLISFHWSCPFSVVARSQVSLLQDGSCPVTDRWTEEMRSMGFWGKRDLLS